MLRKIEQIDKARVGRWFGRFTTVLSGAHLLTLVALPLLFKLFQERFWLLILFRWAPPLCYLALWLTVAGIDLAVRRRNALPVALLSGLLTLGLYSGLCLPYPSTSKGEFKVLTYNIRAGLGGPEAIGKALAAYQADVIALQETRPPHVEEPIDPYQPVMQQLPGYNSFRGGRKGELVLATPHKIVRTGEHTLNQWSGALEIVLEMPNQQTLRVLNVHCVMGNPRGLTPRGLEKSARARHEQARALVELIRKENLPTLLLGDFNSPPGSVLHQILLTEMQDSFQSEGLGFGWTYPEKHPLLRIDQIWYRGLKPTKCRSSDPELSDHLLLWAEFAWPGNS